MSRFSAAPASRLQILLVGLIVSMTWLKSPSVLCSPTGLPTLVNSSAPCPSDPAPLPNGPEEGRPVPGGKDRPRADHGEGWDRRAPSTWEAVRLREANWYPTRNVGASEAIQISANRAECVCHWIDHVRYERLPASSLIEGDVADVDRDRQPFGCGAPIGRGTWLACLTLRDNFKIFGDIGLYATPLVQQHAVGDWLDIHAKRPC